MQSAAATMLVAILASGGPAAAQTSAPAGELLGTVRITDPVLAGGKPLPSGTYELRLMDERPTLPDGQPSESQRYVALVASGAVAAREIAEVFPQDTSVAPGTPRSAPVVQRLRGDEFVRISVRRGAERYLVYLPLAK